MLNQNNQKLLFFSILMIGFFSSMVSNANASINSGIKTDLSMGLVKATAEDLDSTNLSKNTEVINEFRSRNGNNWTVTLSENGSVLDAIRQRPSVTRDNIPEQEAIYSANEFISRNKDLLGITNESTLVIKNVDRYYYRTSDHNRTVEDIQQKQLTEQEEDSSPIQQPNQLEQDSFNWIIKYQQLFKEIHVYNAELRIVFTQDGQVYNLQNRIVSNVNAPTKPKITKDFAINVAKNQVGTKISPEKIDLNVLSKNRLVWTVEFGYNVGKIVFIDAMDGEYLGSISTARTETTNSIAPSFLSNNKIYLVIGIFTIILIVLILMLYFKKEREKS